MLSSAERTVLFVAPFVKVQTLESLLTGVAASVSIELYTRWRVEDVASGVTDTSVLPLVNKRGGSVRLVDDLHAKLIAADSRALAGSANITAAGLGTSARPNLELMVDVTEPGLLLPFMLELRRRSRPATEQEASEVERKAAELRAKLPDIKPPDAAVEVPASQVAAWFPSFRSPDRLFGLYADPEWPHQARTNDPALKDLAHLVIPEGLSQAKFNERVREALLCSAAVRELDPLLDQPRRFGEVTDMMRELLSGTDHQDRQAAAQTLIRWLLHFAGDRYGIRTPNYSEILYRR